ncbi:MAG: M20 metallopeptidase family protein [Thermoplasmatota archaeon]
MAAPLLDDLRRLRQDLHAEPDASGAEAATARAIRDWLATQGLEPLAEEVGGHGLLYQVGDEPKVLLRADLDALPIQETTGASYASDNGHMHACGHDGHAAMLAGALAQLAATGGNAYALFQGAEETGEGAAACLEHPALSDLDVSRCFALHNLPGTPLGQVQVREGPAAVASRGLTIRLQGRSSHASEPFAGRNPAAALATLALEAPGLPNQHLALGAAALVTVVHLEAGARRFGTSADTGSLSVTLRADRDGDVDTLEAELRRRAKGLAQAHGLEASFQVEEPFPACHNDAAAAEQVRRAAGAAGLDVVDAPLQPWSEDFGHLLARWPGALLLLGSGDEQPTLHSSDYDFPDDLLGPGVRLLCALAT